MELLYSWVTAAASADGTMQPEEIRGFYAGAMNMLLNLEHVSLKEYEEWMQRFADELPPDPRTPISG